MAEHTKATGMTTICTGKESISGLMEEGMKESTSTTRNMAMEYTPTQTAEATKEIGHLVNSMAREFSLLPKAHKEKVFGKKARE